MVRLMFGSLALVAVMACTTTTPTPTVAPEPVQQVAYPPIARRGFVDSCTITSGGQRTACTCMFEWLVDNIDYADYLREGEARLSGGSSALDGWLATAADACQP